MLIQKNQVCGNSDGLQVDCHSVAKLFSPSFDHYLFPLSISVASHFDISFLQQLVLLAAEKCVARQGDFVYNILCRIVLKKRGAHAEV